MKMLERRSMACLFHVVYLSTYFQVTAVPFNGMDNNCILSFVVPKEKMKSSCELDEKVNRRINAMETKVNIYKQQVSDMQVQSDKQRQLHTDKMANMEQQVKDISGNMDMGFLIERRLALLEKEFEQFQSHVSSMKSASGKTKYLSSDDKTIALFFNTVDNSPTLSSLAKSMIQAEMKMFLDNYTNRIEGYVQEQILMYNKVFNMLPKRNEDVILNGRTSDASVPPSKEEVKVEISFEKSAIGEGKLEVETDKMDDKLIYTEDKYEKAVVSFLENTTGEEYIDSVADENRNVTDIDFNSTSEYFNITVNYLNATNEVQGFNSTTTINIGDVIGTNSSKIVFIDEMLEINDSFVEKPPRAINSSQIVVVMPKDKEVSKSATSRINSKPETAKDSRNPTDADSEHDKNWNEFMVHDQQFPKQTDIEERIKEEVNSMMLPPIAKVMSLMEEQKHTLEEKIKFQEKRCDKINEDFSKQVKSLDGSVQTITLRIETLSKEFHDSSPNLDKMRSLEALVNELKKTITIEPLTVSALEIEEQSKKLKKLERLMGVYHQSIEYYRNETKNEFREMKDSLEKETTSIRTISKTLQNNLTSTFNSQINKQNSTFMNRILEITEQLRIQDQNLFVLQLDLGNVEKALSGRASKFSDREVDKLQDEMNHLAARQRDFKKKLDHLDQSQANLTESLNMTTNEVSALRIEVKLTLDQWIPMKFEFDTTRTDCFGEQYMKRTQYSKALLVGVVLCSPIRYKIFLSSSLHGKFLNIGDGNGVGEDHCEFVGCNNGTDVKLSPFKPSFGSVQGYARNHWGEKPAISFLNVIKPSPHWYECGIEIP